MKDSLVSILQAGDSIYVYGEKWGISDLKELSAPKIIDFSGFIHHEKNKRCFLELSLSEIWCFGSLALSLPSTTHNVWYEC